MSYKWVQIGTDIYGEFLDEDGSSVSLNCTGDVVAIGAPADDSMGANSGSVRVYGLIKA